MSKVEREKIESIVPNKMWFSLKECCELKGLKYKTICNKPHLEPQKYEVVCGRRLYRRDIVIDWLFMTDDDVA